MSAFTTLKEAIQQNTPTQLSNMDFSQMPGQAPTEWTGAGGVGGSPLIMKTQMGDLSDALADLDQAGTDYYKEEDRLEGLKDEAGVARDIAKENILRERQAFLRGTLPESEARDAAIAQTGMAYSGPAQRRAEIQQLDDKKTLSDIVMDERAVSRDFKESMEDIKGEEEQMETDWTDATEQYGTNLREMTSSAAQNLQTIMDWVNTTLPGQHQQYGADLKGTQEQGNWTDVYKWRDVGRGFMPQRTKHLPTEQYSNIGYKPQGGYFSPTETLPMIPEGRAITQSMSDFNRWLDTQGSAQIAQAFGLPSKPVKEEGV